MIIESSASLEGASHFRPKEWNALAHYTIDGIGDPVGSKISLVPDLYGRYDLTQADTSKQPELLRDHENGLNFLRFDSKRGDFLRSLEVFDPLPHKVTIVILARIRSERIGAEKREPASIGTLLRLGTSQMNLYRDVQSGATELEAKAGQTSTRWKIETSEPQWRLYTISFDDVNGDALFNDVRLTPYFTSGEDSLRMTSQGKISLGHWRGNLGHLDADIAEVLILKEKPPILELIDLSTKTLAETVRPMVSAKSEAVLSSEAFRLQTGLASVEGTCTMNAKPTTDLGDLQNVKAWYSSLDPMFSEFEDEEPLGTWQDGSTSNHDLMMSPDSEGQAAYYSSLYKGGPAILFPKDVEGFAVDSQLDQKPYTIYLVGKSGQESGRFFNIGSKSFQIILSQNKDDKTKNDLEIRVNPSLMSERKATFLASTPREDFFELVLLGKDDETPFGLEVQVDGVTLTPDEQDTVVNVDSPMGAVIDGVTVYPDENDDEVAVGVLFGTLQHVAADLFYGTDQDRTFRIEKDDSVHIGNGKNFAFAQVAWYDRVLDSDELAFIRNWVSDHY